MVRATENVDGILQWNGQTYKAQYNADTGVLELSEHGGATPKAQPQPKPGSSTARTQEAKPSESEPEVPKDMESLKVAIERVLKQNRATKLQHNQLKGKLTLKSRALAKSQTDSKSIHSRKTKANAMGYNVILLVDNSGSMSGGKIYLANAVAKGLHATLRATDGVNVKVLAFTDTMQVKAGWDAKQCETMSVGGGNCDAAACYIAMTRHFADTPDQNYQNILLVLSDGAPCAGALGERNNLPDLDVWGCGDSADECKQIAQFLSGTARQQHVFIAGLGIAHDSTQIPNSRKIDNLKDVQRALIGVLKGAIDSE